MFHPGELPVPEVFGSCHPEGAHVEDAAIHFGLGDVLDVSPRRCGCIFQMRPYLANDTVDTVFFLLGNAHPIARASVLL